MHCSSHEEPPAPAPDPAPVALHWQVISHLNGADTFMSQLTLTNVAATPLEGSGWVLYFNFIRMIDAASLPASVRLTHINGDFFKLEPTDAFPVLSPGESLAIPFETAFWAIKKSDAPAGFYMVFLDDSGHETAPRPVLDYEIGNFETPAQTMRNANDEVPVPTPASRFAENEALQLRSEDTLPPVIPTPLNWRRGDGEVSLDGDTRIHHAEGLEGEAAQLASSLAAVLTNAPTTHASEASGPGIILLNRSASAGSNESAYTLTVAPERGIHIQGSNAAGVFYGTQSLLGLIDPQAYASPGTAVTVPAFEIEDAPRFSYRGLHLDVSRNFHTKAEVLQLLDLMGLYKLNKFHFHLTDDEGWRLEIAGLPELTDVGGRRGHTLDESDRLYPAYGSGPAPDSSPGSGHYSREDFIEILRFARTRHIEVIPEIDLPGHARAAIRAMEARYQRLAASGDEAGANQYRLVHPEDTSVYRSVQMWNDNVVDVCLPATYAFVELVTDDLMSMYAAAGLQLHTLHIGNDEVPHGAWGGSPACAALATENYNAYFLESVDDLLAARDITLAGWEEIALMEQERNGVTAKVPNPAFVDDNFRPYVWNAVWGWGAEGTAYQLANAGYKIVMSNATNLYFDFAYDKDPEEPGFYWAGFSNTRKTFVFNPFDLYQNASQSLMGQPIDASVAYQHYPRLTAAGRQNILGIQGQLWSEAVKTPALLQYQLFPKMLGLAERAWAPEPAWFSATDPEARQRAEQQGWNVFANKLGQHELPRLGFMADIGFRIPPPGARVNLGQVEANVAFPGMQIHYTTEDRAPSRQDPVYTGPVPFEGLINLRAFAANGRASRTTTIGR